MNNNDQSTSSDLTALPRITSDLQRQFQQSHVMQVVENGSRNIASTAILKFRTNIKKECSSIDPMICSVRWLRVPSTIVSKSVAYSKDPISIKESRANAMEVTIVSGRLVATFAPYTEGDVNEKFTDDVMQREFEVSQVSFSIMFDEEIEIPKLPLVRLTYVRTAIACNRESPNIILTLSSETGANSSRCKFILNGREIGEAMIAEVKGATWSRNKKMLTSNAKDKKGELYPLDGDMDSLLEGRLLEIKINTLASQLVQLEKNKNNLRQNFLQYIKDEDQVLLSIGGEPLNSDHKKLLHSQMITEEEEIKETISRIKIELQDNRKALRELSTKKY